jgi:Lrp/AsnC family transcriptional regulator, leucine-responsive regulatory protein
MKKTNNNFMDLSEFNKKTRFNERLGLDDRDNIILSMIQKEPMISQEEIAAKIKLSQPSVGARIRKLRERGVLHTINGVNFKVVDLKLAKIEVMSTDTNAIIDQFKNCPFFVNAMTLSGKYNLCLFFMATDIESLDKLVTCHLRTNPMVKDMEMNIVISTTKDFVMPLNINFDEAEKMGCGNKCDVIY